MSPNTSNPEGQYSKPQSHPNMSSRLLPTHKATLSEDILFVVFEALPKSSLRTVSQVSKAFHDLALLVLYHTVDFSANTVIDIHGVVPRYWSPQRSINALQIRQWRFAQQIARKTSYGTLVRSFAWTMGFENRMHLSFLINEKWDDTVIYTMFSHLTLATHITIDASTAPPKTIPHLHALFLSATHIHLGGKTTYAFASSILHNPVSTILHSLTLDNVIEGGLIQDPASKESRPITRSSTDDRERLIHVPENWPPESLPLQVRPGTAVDSCATSPSASRDTSTRTRSSRARGIRSIEMCLMSGFPSSAPSSQVC